MPNYLLYIPSGGMTQMLRTFGNSLIYANETSRICVPLFGRHESFGGPLSSVFNINSAQVTEDYESIGYISPDSSITNCLNDISLRFDNAHKGYVLNSIASSPIFELRGKSNYLSLPISNELLRSQYVFTTGFTNEGWPKNYYDSAVGISCSLQNLSLKFDISKYSISFFKKLPNEYIGVHYRNTDYRNDIDLTLEKILEASKKINIKNIFWATDDFSSIKIASEALSGFRIFSGANTIDHVKLGLRNIHNISDNILRSIDLTRLDLHKDFFADMLCLVQSEIFIGSRISSISTLVNILRNNPSALKNKFFGLND